jgi:transposase
LHGNVPVVTELSLLVRQYDYLTKMSVAIENYLSAFKREFGVNPIKVDTSELEAKRRELVKQINELVKSNAEKTQHLKGVGGLLLAKLLAYAHPKRFPSLRKFLAYCGYKQSSAETGRYNRKAKKTVKLMVDTLIMNKDDFYYPLYELIRCDLEKKHPEYPRHKIDGMTRNRVGTFLLKELYRLFR